MRLLAILLGLSLIAAACGDDDDDDGGGGGGGGGEEAGKLIYFVEGNMSDAFAEGIPEEGVLVGVQGTIPGAEVSGEFRSRMDEEDPSLPAYTYGPETYDAIVIMALAAELAGTDQSDLVAQQINGVTRDGTECTSYEECLPLAQAGEDIDYNGIVGPLNFAAPGEPAAASYGIYDWLDDNSIDFESPTYVDVEVGPAPEGADPADDPVAALAETGDADPSCTADTDGVFTLGGILATSGELGDLLGAPQVAGANLALADINEAGGVLGQPLEFDQLDSGESAEEATPQVQSHIQNNVDAILGASASEISSAVIDSIVSECIIMFSPSNTGPVFTTYADDDLYFRTASADILQGRVLAQNAIEAGAESAAILYREDPYGQGMSEYIALAFEEAGGSVDINTAYNPEATEFSAEVQEVIDADPDVLFLVGFAESAQIYTDLYEGGFQP